MDQLIVRERRLHKAKMEQLYKNFLGKRVEDAKRTENRQVAEERAYSPEGSEGAASA
jgi:hypothetical protein